MAEGKVQVKLFASLDPNGPANPHHIEVGVLELPIQTRVNRSGGGVDVFVDTSNIRQKIADALKEG